MKSLPKFENDDKQGHQLDHVHMGSTQVLDTQMLDMFHYDNAIDNWDYPYTCGWDTCFHSTIHTEMVESGLANNTIAKHCGHNSMTPKLSPRSFYY